MMLALLWFPLAHAGSVHADQARIYARQHYYADALAEAAAGLAEPSPADALELYAIGVDAAWELGDIDRVLQWSQQAADLAVDPALHDAWQARHDTVASSWGWVRVASPGRGVRLEPGEPVLDPEQKRVAAVIARRAEDGGDGRYALPAGLWRVDGQPVTVPAGGTVDVAGGDDRRGLALRAGAGVEARTGEAAWTAAPAVDLGADLRLGAWTLGASARWAPQGWVDAGGGRMSALDAGSAALWFGAALRAADGLELLPSVGVGASRLQGPDGAGWGVGPTARLAVGCTGAVPVGVAIDAAWWPGADTTAVSLGAYVGR